MAMGTSGGSRSLSESPDVLSIGPLDQKVGLLSELYWKGSCGGACPISQG